MDEREAEQLRGIYLYASDARERHAAYCALLGHQGEAPALQRRQILEAAKYSNDPRQSLYALYAQP